MMCDITMQPLFSKTTIFGLGLLYICCLCRILYILVFPLLTVALYLPLFSHISGIAGLIGFITFIMCGVGLSMLYADAYMDL